MYVSAVYSDPAAEHMHVPVILQFSDHSPISTLAFLDSGAQTSLIGEHFVSKHALGCQLLDFPLLLKSYNGSTSDKVMQGVLAHLSISNHSEHKSFGIARMPHDLILHSVEIMIYHATKTQKIPLETSMGNSKRTSSVTIDTAWR